MDQGISYVDEPVLPNVQGITYVDDETTPGPQFPPMIVARRAEEADYAMGDKSPGYEELTDRFHRGDEDHERRLWAHAQDSEKASFRRELVEKLILDRPHEVTPEIVSDILNL